MVSFCIFSHPFVHIYGLPVVAAEGNPKIPAW